MEVKYRLQYTGQSADENRLPAHLGAVSVEGFSWSLSLIANYIATGKIKSRGNMSDKVQVYLSPARPGSYITDLWLYVTEPNNLFLTSILGVHAVSTVGQMINSVIVSSLRQVSGIEIGTSAREDRWLGRFPSGDMEALVDRIEPSMQRAHMVIDEGARLLTVRRAQTPVLVLDTETKAFINTNTTSPDEIRREVSVGAFNANSGNGRVFLPDIGKTVPFSVVREPVQGTYASLTYSLDRYVRGLPSTIEIYCHEVLTTDDRLKKLIITGANRIISVQN